MTTGARLTGSVSVRKLQTVLHAKAKEEPGRRFHALADKVWREDFLLAVAQTSAMLVLSPIFEADLEAGAVRIPAGTKRQGRGQAGPPPAAHGPQRSDRCGPLELLRRDTARRVDEECCPARERRADARTHQGVAGDAGGRGRREGRHAPHEPGAEGAKGDSAGSPDLAAVEQHLHAAVYPCWKALGHARRFSAEIVNYADDFCVLGKAPAAEMLAVVNRLMERLKLPVNARKTRCLRCPEEPLEFPGYRIGWTIARRTEAGTPAPGPARRAFRAYAAGSGRKRSHGTRAVQQRRS